MSHRYKEITQQHENHIATRIPFYIEEGYIYVTSTRNIEGYLHNQKNWVIALHRIGEPYADFDATKQGTTP